MIKALINTSADVSTRTPRDTKENILRNGVAGGEAGLGLGLSHPVSLLVFVFLPEYCRHFFVESVVVAF